MGPKNSPQSQDEEMINELDFLLSMDVLQEAEELEIDFQDSSEDEELL